LKKVKYKTHCRLRSTLVFVFLLGSLSTFSQSNLTIDDSNSPFHILSDTTIESGDTLLLLAGAELFMGDHVDVFIKGVLRIKGDAENRVNVRPVNPGIGWGEFKIATHVDSLIIENAFIEDGRFLSYNTINIFENVEFVNNQNLAWDAAISRFIEGELNINNCKIYGSNKGEGFLVHSINNPQVLNSYFNAIPDAVEYLNCTEGRIGKCQFFDMIDDAIDLNNCYKTLLDSNLMVSIGDRAMEIGSENFGSSREIQVYRNVLVNCEEGVNFKEGSTGSIVNNTFYQNQKAVTVIADGRPNIGSSVQVVNCIFDQNQTPIYKDNSSSYTVDFSSSSSTLLIGTENLFVAPNFNNPTSLDFSLKPNSKCIDAGDRNAGKLDRDNTYLDLGALYFDQSIKRAIQSEVTLFPNPTSSILNVKVVGYSNQIQIINSNGQLQREVDIISNYSTRIKLNVSSLNRGLYVLVITGETGKSRHKFVKL